MSAFESGTTSWLGKAFKAKARFFSGHGFVAERWEAWAEALRQHALENEIAKRETAPLGERFVVEGPMKLADGTVAGIRSVWFFETGERTLRFVTAYPLRQRKLL